MGISKNALGAIKQKSLQWALLADGLACRIEHAVRATVIISNHCYQSIVKMYSFPKYVFEHMFVLCACFIVSLLSIGIVSEMTYDKIEIETIETAL